MRKMHNPKTGIDGQYAIKRKEGWRGVLLIEATYKTEIISITEYLNTKYAEDLSGNKPDINWTTKTAVKDVEELNQSKEKSDTKQEGIQYIKARLGESKFLFTNKRTFY
jgi:hypothetical protein